MNDKKKKRRQKTEDRSQKSVLCPLSSVLCALLLAGCAKQQQYEAVEQIYVPDIDKADAMQIAEDVLAKMHFTIEKADANSGIVRTRPLPGAQFFEFWRSDNVGAFNTAEANLQSIRRTAQINIKPQACPEQGRGNDKLHINCDVQVQRLSVPNFEFRISNFEFPALGGMAWIDLGKDTNLATEILKRIEKQIVTSVPSSVSRTSHASRATSDEK